MWTGGDRGRERDFLTNEKKTVVNPDRRRKKTKQTTMKDRFVVLKEIFSPQRLRSLTDRQKRQPANQTARQKERKKKKTEVCVRKSPAGRRTKKMEREKERKGPLSSLQLP
mmetsp:Transcript_12846/g.25116  ORF Transcript_12846/g.25116 Transcript_12846/m.25116 type:complete len:111 (-) Transcript_12846:25-357(-)